MGRNRILTFHLVAILLIFSARNSLAQFSYNITKTWNNTIPSDKPEIRIEFIPSASSFPDSLEVLIEAPLYNDPLPPNATIEEPFVGLWDYEVVEAFFLGENDEYLEMEFSPSGHYLLYFLKGRRNVSEVYMPLVNGSFTTEKNTTHWTGRALIPGHYFPCNSDSYRFNAYAIHYSNENRRYMSLFPVENGEIPNPDFHYLEAFREIRFPNELNPFCPQFRQFYDFMINRTWNGAPVETSAYTFLQYDHTENEDVVHIKMNAPFYNNPLPPDNNDTDTPFVGLWDYEVVEAFFLGDEEKYLETEFSPSGHYLIYFLQGYRNVTNATLPIEKFSVKKSNPNLATLSGNRWIGDAQIPSVYFPCNIRKMNGHAIHGSNESRRYMSLFPVGNGEIPGPDFHYFAGFGNFTFDHEVNQECSSSARLKDTWQFYLYAALAVVSSSFGWRVQD